jgi:hypothetical protein
MQKVLKQLANLLGRVLFIGFGIQIVLGILWMCNAFAGLGFGEGIVCVGELLLFGAAVYFLARSFKKYQGVAGAVFVTLSAVTFPMVMQSLVTVDGRVFASAFLLLELGCILRAAGDLTGRKYFAAALGFWVAAGLVRAEYLYIGALPPTLLWLLAFIRGVKLPKEQRIKQSRQWNQLLLIMAVGGIIAGVGSFYREPVNLTVCMTSRLAWTNLHESYEKLSGTNQKAIGYWDMTESSYEAVGVEENLFPALEEKWGTREAEDLLRKLAAAAWRKHKAGILKEIVWDMAGYIMAPAVLPLQLQGRAYDSYSGINYRQILDPMPQLGKFYMDYGCWWFAAALILRILQWLAVERRAPKFACVLTVSTGLLMALLYTMSGAGKMDYRNTVFILCVWLVWMAPTVMKKQAKGGSA